MSRRNNVNPDHYKVGGRLRPDDLASAEFSRAIAAKTASQQRPDRMGKGLYFERTESQEAEIAPATAGRAKKKASARAGTPKKKAGARKATKRDTPRKVVSAARKRSSSARTPPSKKR